MKKKVTMPEAPGVKIFKITAQGDVVYVLAEDSSAALLRVRKVCGPIPANMMSISTVPRLPAGETFL